MTCPICGKNPSPEMRPFCSKRCADIDLGKWLGEGYRVAGGFDTDEDLGDFEGADGALGEDKLH